MQMKEKEGQSRFVRLQNPGDEFAVHRSSRSRIFMASTHDRSISSLPTASLPSPRCGTNESNELSEIVLRSSLSQIRNRHGSLPLIHTEHCAAETSADTHARESLFTALSFFRLGAGAENTTNRLRSFCESHRHRIHAVTQTRRGRAIVEHVP